MIINSDWHIHTNASYDASLPIEDILKNAKEFGFRKVGITDHANFNDTKFIGDLKKSAQSVKTLQTTHPELVLGVELTPIEKPEFDYIAKTGTREGYVAPIIDEPFQIELACTKSELMSLGVRYAIGAAHWRVDVPGGRYVDSDRDTLIKEWYRQQMWLANDERVTILGHPWWNPKRVWYSDFSVIPKSMNDDIASALKENGKYAECNVDMLCSADATEKFRRQYAEFLRELFEKGIRITYGSDSHEKYTNRYLEAEKRLAEVGFKTGDFSEIDECDLW